MLRAAASAIVSLVALHAAATAPTGYGDNRAFSDMTRSLEPEVRQLVLKFSYAFQL